MSMTNAAAHRKLTQRTAIEAALSNEQVTRTRVDRLERARIADVARLDELQAWRRRGFWGRLRWLVRGK